MRYSLLKVLISFSWCCVFFLSESVSNEIFRLQIETKIDSILQLMTLDEKVGQLIQYSGRWQDSSATVLHADQLALIRKNKVGSFLNVFGADLTKHLQTIALKESRLKIPLLFGQDVIHGFRTIFPIPLGEAAAWDPLLSESAARVAAREASAMGVHWTFAPMVDIARDARWGRIAEGSGEDPYLGECLAEAKVKGFQGDDLSNAETIASCPKHFAAYGAAEGGRDYNSVDISERTLREIYLKPFQKCVKIGAASIMCSFNDIAGIPSSANEFLLTQILRKEWHFDGMVVSDWNSVGELVAHGVAAGLSEAASLAIQSGVDMDMEGYAYTKHLEELVRQNLVPVATVDEAVRRVLRLKFRLGLFDNPFQYCQRNRELKQLLTAEHRFLARELAGKSLVLLKNDKRILPLSKHMQKIAVIGPLADDQQNILGSWSCNGKSKDAISVLRGIQNKIADGSTILYAQGCGIMDSNRTGFNYALKIAQQSEVVILVVGESAQMSGEAASRSNLDLPGLQRELIYEIRKIGKPLVVIIMNGRPLALPWLDDQSDALLVAWFAGTEAGNAIADVVFGDVNPSGKLPVTFPRSVGQIPFYYNHKNTGRPALDEQNKYNSRYFDLPNSSWYPFGYGLSYSEFEYMSMTLDRTELKSTDTLRINVKIRNKSNFSGEEIVQLYIRDMVSSIARPIKELKGFKRIKLEAGELKSVDFIVTPEQLSFYNIHLQWVLEPGDFKISSGPNSITGLEQQFRIIP